MLTKTEFFQILRDIRANITTRICIRVENKTFTALVAEQTSAPNEFLSRHKDDAALDKAFAKYDAWLNEWFMSLDAMIAADHDEALAMNAEIHAEKVSRCRDAVFFGSLDSFGRRVIVEAAHAEALEMNESMPRAIIVGDIHCSSDCGYGCKAEVKRYLEARYAPIVEDLGEGWRVRSWHNTGWHCEAYHDASGASVSDSSLRGGVNTVLEFDMYGDRGRFLFNRYGDNGFMRQVQASGPTPHEAMMNAVNEMRAIAVANIQMADLLAGAK